MKRIFKQLLLIIAILLYCTNCAFAATYPCDGQVLKNAVNVRKKASQGSDQVGKLKRDEVVTVIGEETNGDTVWYEIELGKGQSGYVRGDLIELISEAPNASAIASLSVGDRLFMGEWEQDNKSNNGSEPIEWQVLAVEDNRALVITVDGIDTEMYGDSVFSTDLCWETSSLRKWMNESFYSAAFSEEEKETISLTTNDNGNGYNRTGDYVFSLSIEEARMYFPNASIMACKPTDYAKSKIGKTNALDSGGYGIWWLRDMTSTYKKAESHNFTNSTYNEVAYVNMRKGIEDKEGMAPVYTDGILARPAMWIQFSDDSETSKENNPQDIEIGNHVTFGECEQDNDPNNGKESIEWIVLDKAGNRILVVSKYALDCKPYNTTAQKAEWKTCTLRTWLNDTFISDAFDKEERLAIPAVTVLGIEEIDLNLYSSGTKKSQDTSDQIFLLSGEQLDQYLPEDGHCDATPYANKRGCTPSGDGKGYSWWLRSSGSRSLGGFSYIMHGPTEYVEKENGVSKAVRPAMWIDLSVAGNAVALVTAESTPVPSATPKPTETILATSTPVEQPEMDNDDGLVFTGEELTLFSQDDVELYLTGTYEVKPFLGEKRALRLDAVVVNDRNEDISFLATAAVDGWSVKAYFFSEASISEAAYARSKARGQIVLCIEEGVGITSLEEIKNISLDYRIYSVQYDGTVRDMSSISQTGPIEIEVSLGKESDDVDEEAVNAEDELSLVPDKTIAPTSVAYSNELISFANATIGDYITFGSYEQDGNEENGKENIEWVVLAKENNRWLVVSRYALDCQPYNESVEEVTWETCSLRMWLNKSFYNSAFNREEQDLIDLSTVTVDQNPKDNTIAETTTQDKVFLLNVAEAKEYFSSDEMRQCQGTVYARKQGAAYDTDRECYWWLRTIDDIQTVAMDVDPDGIIEDVGFDVYNSCVAVRPAMWIDLNP